MLDILTKHGPEDWHPFEDVTIKSSSSRSGNFDKFSLSNSVELIGRILKTDVVWVIYEKQNVLRTRSLPTINAFEVLKNAASALGLPGPIVKPFNQKQNLFNSILTFLSKEGVTFSKTDCDARIKNKKTGAATDLVYEITEIIWKIGQAEKQLKSSSLWNKLLGVIKNHVNFDVKSKDPIHMTQHSSRVFAANLREIASRALMANEKLSELKVALLSSAEVFDQYSDYLKAHLENVKKKSFKGSVSTAAEAVVMEISNREKVSLIEMGSKPLKNQTVIKIFKKLDEEGPYNPVNISTILPTNRVSRSTILHRDLPNQAQNKIVLWTFDNGPAPQSIFAFIVEPNDTQQTILEKTNQLKPQLQILQKFYYPREFYRQFYDKIGAVTGISSQDLRLMCSMVMGDERKFDGEVKKRFEEAVMSGDPDYVYDLRHFNGRDIKYKEFLSEFRNAVQEYMVEDRGRHETQYNGTIISKVSFGFSMKQMFKTVCEKVKEKNPNCPLPSSEFTIARYLVPRTQAAASSASKSEPLIPLKLAMQQKVIEKPNVDAHYNAAQYKYLRSFAVLLGPDLVTMVGWDDKTGVDVGEPEQPVAATQHAGKSWVHQEVRVGEGQHSFHKTNLTPSVRLVHEIGGSIEESFYRGLPQVVIKDAIFQHSTSVRHATELFQMFQKYPHLIKPVLILTNDGGNDHTIRHDRNILSMLALFLNLPETLLLINFQMAAYRSAYHPVEKLNCILNLAWNGVALNREIFDDQVLENAFSQCNSMSDVRLKAEKHPGIKDALHRSLEPSIKILEERAKHASLKENSFETFKPATDEDIKAFLSVVQNIDEDFDVERYLNKKKPYHLSPILKSFIEEHMTPTYYSLSFMRHKTLSVEVLREKYPLIDWPAGLEPLPCPVINKENPDKYLSHEEVMKLLIKDYSDSFRPGASKTPSNIPFAKNKQRAVYGSKLGFTCDVCGKQRVAYLEHRPSESDIDAAMAALKNVKYICGGRVSSFGRSLSLLEEICNEAEIATEVLDEIEREGAVDRESNDVPEQERQFYDVFDEFDDTDYSYKQVRKKKKMIIESDESDDDLASVQSLQNNPVSDSDSDDDLKHEVLDILNNPEQSMEVDDGVEVFSRPPCSVCGKFETGHRCKHCSAPCCNMCNTIEDVEELSDIVCPVCDKELKVNDDRESTSKPRGRGRPRKSLASGTILIPLEKKRRGRPRKVQVVEETVLDVDNNNEPSKDCEDADPSSETSQSRSDLPELRILGSSNVLSKIFVDESLTCDSPVESHMYDILLMNKKPLPCSHCGETDEIKMFSKLSDECFPLCKDCQDRGRGAGARRKSRKILPQNVKPKKNMCSKPRGKNKNRRQQFID